MGIAKFIMSGLIAAFLTMVFIYVIKKTLGKSENPWIQDFIQTV